MTYQHIRHGTTARQYSTRKAFRHNIYHYGHLDTNIRKAEGRCKSKNKVFQIWLCRGASYTENTILYAYPFKIHFRDKRHANAPQKTFARRGPHPRCRRHDGIRSQYRKKGFSGVDMPARNFLHRLFCTIVFFLYICTTLSEKSVWKDG